MDPTVKLPYIAALSNAEANRHAAQLRPHGPQRPSRLPLKLPSSILKQILRYALRADPPRRLLLPLTSDQVKRFRKAIARVSVFQACSLMRRIGLEIIFADHIFMASSPSGSYHLDQSIYSLSVWQRELIRSIFVKIDWADELWAKFPLVAVALCELRTLYSLEIFFVQKVVGGDGKLVWDGAESLEIREATSREEVRGWKREGGAAEVMLKAEKKMFWDLVLALKALRIFRLVGFVDEEFARKVELWVSARDSMEWGSGPQGWMNLAFLGSS